MNPRLTAVALALATLNLVGCGPDPVPPDTAAPPTSSSRSSTRTRRPARARYPAATSPLCPPPTTTASKMAMQAA